MSEPTEHHSEIAALLSVAGIKPDASQLEMIVDAYGHVKAMLASIPRDFNAGDEPVRSFDPGCF